MMVRDVPQDAAQDGIEPEQEKGSELGEPSSYFIRFLLRTKYLRYFAKRMITHYVTSPTNEIRLRVRNNDPNVKGMLEEIYGDRVYEREFSPQAGDVVLDIGANIGAYSVRVSKAVGPEGLVVAIEPESGNFRLLVDNIRRNRCPNVTPVFAALGCEAGFATLQVYRRRGSDSVFSRSEEKLLWVERVKRDTIDNIVAQKRLDRLNVLKLDTEGSELDILKGGKEALTRFKPKIVGEAHPTFSDSGQAILEYLTKYGYRGKVLPHFTGLEMFYACERSQTIPFDSLVSHELKPPSGV